MGVFSRVTPHAPRLAAFVLAPVLIPQGRRTLARVPRLPEASGPPSGTVGATTEACGDDRALRLLVVGESTAVGVGVETHEEGIAAALAQRLHAGTGRPVSWTVIGRNGARLRSSPRRRLPDPRGEHDLAVVVLGVNDTLGLTSVGRWVREMTALLDRIGPLTKSGGLVVLAGVPKLGAFPALPQPLRFVMGRHGRVLDDALDDLAEHRPNTAHVPTPALEDDRDLATDGFHPSAQGYRRWADRLYDDAVHPWAAQRST